MERFLQKLAEAQFRRPYLFLSVAVLLSVVSFFFVRNLGVDSRFIALLPEDRASVQDLERVRDRVRGLSTMTIAVESPSKDVPAMRRFVDDLVARLGQMSPDEVGDVDWNVGAYKTFVEDHKHLYADEDLLVRLRDALEERLDRERLKKNPFWIDLEGDDEIESVEDVLDELEAETQSAEDKSDRYPDGYYQHEDKDLIAVFSRTDVGGDAYAARRVIDRVQAVIDEIDPSSYAPDMQVTLSGDVIIAKEEQQAIARELILATCITIAVVLLLIVLFFGRFRALSLLGAGLIPPVLMSFAFAELTVGSLNTSTAFLGSIIIGNGINPNVIWLSRYFEERRRCSSVSDALLVSHKGTWLATMIASGAAALAYGSLMITDFRGFRDFGIIGGVGMVLCWLSAMLILPAGTAAYERFRPFPPCDEERIVRSGRYADAFAATARRFPGPVMLVSALISLVSVAAVVHAVINDPIEYDFRTLRSVREEGDSEARRVQQKVNKLVKSHEQGRGIAVLLPSVDELPGIEAQLDAMDPSVHGGYHTLEDFLPQEVERKIPLLAEIRELCLDMQDYVEDEETLQKIEDNIPPEQLLVPTLEDLPDEVARRFSERDGSRGRIMTVAEAENHSIWDGRYLVRWADGLRGLRLSDGTRPPLAGRAPVFADVIDAVYDDMPKAITAAFCATLILVIASFRRPGDSMLSIMALLMGIVWMAGTMALIGMKLNFLNFVAFPITFGNGVDYSINVMRRYRLEADAGTADPISAAVERSGGAVVLCSLTTIVGYTSLFVSANQAMNSFGLAMAISEVTCLLAAVLTMPALMFLLRGRKAAAK